MISIKPEIIFHNKYFLISNTLLTSFLVIFLIFIFLIFFKKKLSPTPSKMQIFFEIIFEEIFNFWKGLTNSSNLKIFTFILTFFVYILLSNWFGVLPFISSLFLKNEDGKVHLLRSPYSDLNMTLALGLISVFFVNLVAILKLKTKYFLRFKGVVGVFEIISEFVKILSLSFRLFGNILAGEVLILVILSLFPLFIPIFFTGIEMFVGFIQAFLFFVLTSIFLKVALSQDH